MIRDNGCSYIVEELNSQTGQDEGTTSAFNYGYNKKNKCIFFEQAKGIFYWFFKKKPIPRKILCKDCRYWK